MQFITLRTITTDILNIIRGSNISDSEAISKRQVEDWIHQYRTILLLRHYHEEAYCLDCEDDCYVEEKELIENEVQEESKTEQKSS